MKVANMALESPLLNHNDIAGAKNILINITSGDEEITLEETLYDYRVHSGTRREQRRYYLGSR